MSHTQSPSGKWVWEADLCEPYPVATGKVGMGDNSACTIPSHDQESGYGRQICVSHTRSPSGKWVWGAPPHAPYPVAAGKAGMGVTLACTIPGRHQESGYGGHPHMHHTQSPSGKWVWEAPPHEPYPVATRKEGILDNKDNIFCSDDCRNMPYCRG